ncbi:MAG: FkbM family methyltransferase [Blastocatellia bacterium]|nr:FkbM family methyltransferase [Blastocatellia bacterium]
MSFFGKARQLFGTLSYILNAPLNQSQKGRALRRYFGWQIGSRLLPGGAVVPFVNQTRLLVQPGMAGATGNIYAGLHEFEDMSLVLHALRPEDLFVDIGANVGTYSVLAAGAVGTRCVAVEPVPSTFAHLVDNIRLNHLENRVQTCNLGIGGEPGTLRFSAELDTVNHVIPESDTSLKTIQVDIQALDVVLGGEGPTLIKIDVEGFETEVIRGAAETLAHPKLLALIMELNGSGGRYGFDEEALHRNLCGRGFRPCTYQPWSRTLVELPGKNPSLGNTVYVKDFETLQKRVGTAPKFEVQGVWL